VIEDFQDEQKYFLKEGSGPAVLIVFNGYLKLIIKHPVSFEMCLVKPGCIFFAKQMIDRNPGMINNPSFRT
jgi:hypothetical protein